MSVCVYVCIKIYTPPMYPITCMYTKGQDRWVSWVFVTLGTSLFLWIVSLESQIMEVIFLGPKESLYWLRCLPSLLCLLVPRTRSFILSRNSFFLLRYSLTVTSFEFSRGIPVTVLLDSLLGRNIFNIRSLSIILGRLPDRDPETPVLYSRT